MLNNFPVSLVIGTLLGFLSGLGVGGGSLLVMWLTLVVGIEHSIARTINLLFFIPSALITSLFRWKQGRFNIKKVLPAIISGCISAGIFSALSQNLEVTTIKKLFGILLLITGTKELLYKPNQRLRKAK